MIGRRVRWPRAPKALRQWVFVDVDQASLQVQEHLVEHDWWVVWAESERLLQSETTDVKVELWEIRYRRLTSAEIFRYYVLDATVWLPLGRETRAAFFHVRSFAHRQSAWSAYEQFRARLPGAVA